MKKAPDKIYLRVAPSGAIMPVVHTKPAEDPQRCVEYVRADLVVETRKINEWTGPDGRKHRTYADRQRDASQKRERERECPETE